ncbi:prefoldin subunit alpha, partial [bacterium LRH843]|nr:prefoldin subunit alpha [bacterium LRH843]
MDIAQKKLTGSQHVLEKITPEMNGKEVLVPLTGSMYVYGNIADSNNVLIDVGAAYYVQKDVSSAVDYFKRKSVFVNEQMMKV